MSATSSGIIGNGSGGGGGGSVSDGSDAGESTQSTMSITDSPSTSFQAKHENGTKVSLSEENDLNANGNLTGSKINLTSEERQQSEGVVNMGFDYEEKTNRGDYDFKSINGSEKKDKVPEAVNLELVNMVPFTNGNGTNYGVPVNGIPGIPVKKDSDAADMSSPYDEYFVPVNEHKKYMRGEKLYVTKDKRRPASWRRCLSWIVACSVITILLVLAILAGTGVILSQEPNAVKEASIGRNFAGANLKPVGSDNSINATRSFPFSNSSFLSTSNLTHVYVPRSIESKLIIDNMDVNPALLDKKSTVYKEFSTAMEDQLKMILFDKETLAYGALSLNLNVVNISQNPFKVLYRIGWRDENQISIENVKNRLIENLSKNNGYIDKYHISKEGIKFDYVSDVCKIDNYGCSHICYYNYLNLLFTCTCPTNLILDKNEKTCIEWLESSEQDYASVPNHTTYPEVHYDFNNDNDHQEHNEKNDDFDVYHKFENEGKRLNTNESESDSRYDMKEGAVDPAPTPASEPSPEPVPELTAGPPSEPIPEPTPEPTAKPSLANVPDTISESSTKTSFEFIPEPTPKYTDIFSEPTSQPAMQPTQHFNESAKNQSSHLSESEMNSSLQHTDTKQTEYLEQSHQGGIENINIETTTAEYKAKTKDKKSGLTNSLPVRPSDDPEQEPAPEPTTELISEIDAVSSFNHDTSESYIYSEDTNTNLPSSYLNDKSPHHIHHHNSSATKDEHFQTPTPHHEKEKSELDSHLSEQTKTESSVTTNYRPETLHSDRHRVPLSEEILVRDSSLKLAGSHDNSTSDSYSNKLSTSVEPFAKDDTTEKIVTESSSPKITNQKGLDLTAISRSNLDDVGNFTDAPESVPKEDGETNYKMIETVQRSHSSEENALSGKNNYATVLLVNQTDVPEDSNSGKSTIHVGNYENAERIEKNITNFSDDIVENNKPGVQTITQSSLEQDPNSVSFSTAKSQFNIENENHPNSEDAFEEPATTEKPTPASVVILSTGTYSEINSKHVTDSTEPPPDFTGNVTDAKTYGRTENSIHWSAAPESAIDDHHISLITDNQKSNGTKLEISKSNEFTTEQNSNLDTNLDKFDKKEGDRDVHATTGLIIDSDTSTAVIQTSEMATEIVGRSEASNTSQHDFTGKVEGDQENKDSNATTIPPEEFSNNIKDEGTENEEFNTLLGKSYKSKGENSNDGKELVNVKYPNKQTFLKAEKKKLKDFVKGDKPENEKRINEETTKPVTSEDFILQKHVSGNAFDEYHFSTERVTTNDGALGHVHVLSQQGVPGVPFKPYGIENHDISILQTGVRTETITPEEDEETEKLRSDVKKITDTKDGEYKVDKEFPKFDKDYKFKGAKKKEIKKKGSTKDGKNVELDDGRKFYTEFIGKDETVTVNQEITPDPSFTESQVMNEKEIRTVPTIAGEEKARSEGDRSNITSEINSPEIKEPQSGNEGKVDNQKDVEKYKIAEDNTPNSHSTTFPSSQYFNTDEINARNKSDHTKKITGASEGTHGKGNISTSVTSSSRTPLIEDSEKANETLFDIGRDAKNDSLESITANDKKEMTFEHPTQIVAGSKKKTENDNSKETERTPTAMGAVIKEIEGFETTTTISTMMKENEPTGTPGTVFDEQQPGMVTFTDPTTTFSPPVQEQKNSPLNNAEINASTTPNTVFDAVTAGIVPANARHIIGGPTTEGDHSTFTVHQHTSQAAKFLYEGIATTEPNSFISTLSNESSTLPPSISGPDLIGRNDSYHGNRGGNSGTASYSFNDISSPASDVSTRPSEPGQIENFNFSNENESITYPSRMANVQYEQVSDLNLNTPDQTFNVSLKNFSVSENTTPSYSVFYKIENGTLPGTVFDGNFTPQDGHYHMYTNSTGTYVYKNLTTRPTFVIKGQSGDFGKSMVYVLGNNSGTITSYGNSTGFSKPNQAILRNSTVFTVRNFTQSLQTQNGTNESFLLSHQFTPSSFSSATTYKVGDYFGYISKCASGQFQCVNGTSKRGSACIGLSSKCDSINDCSDGSDEVGCLENGCPGNFRCSDGTCLKRHLVCNGIVECSDGSDEKECGQWKCEFDEFQCPSGRCIPIVWQCDSKADCDNHTDEQNCQRTCGNDEYLCPEGWCVPLTYKCNGIKECSNGEDEQFCDCPVDQFKCASGGCIPMDKVCDGLDDCPDRSDEWSCVKLESNSTQLQIRTSSGDYLPVCADNWSSAHSDEVCAFLGYSTSLPLEGDMTSSNLTEMSFYILKNKTTEFNNNNILVNLERTNGSCLSGKMVEINCQEFSCGSRSMTDISGAEARLVGGMSATAGQWPSVALLYNVRNLHSCTANVLTPRWVLASYNCLKMGNKNINYQDWKFFGGSPTFESEKENAETRKILAVVPHPQVKFNQFLFSNDFALVKLDLPLPLSNNLGAVCLPENDIQPRQICVSAGWGMDNPGDKNIKQQLQYLPVPTTNLADCNSSEHYSGFITDDKICAGYNTAEKSLCYNEEGAPLMCINDRGEWELQGVLSYHSNCGRGSHPSIFSSITPVRDWIKHTIGSSFERKTTVVTKR